MRENAGPFFARIAAELAVIFIGVSAAFIVDNYREGLEAKHRAEVLATALIGDLDKFAVAGGAYSSGIHQGLADFDAARAAAGRPVPYTLRVPGAEGPPVDVWEAAMQSGAGEVIDQDLVLELASLYHEIGGQASKYMRYAEFTERNVWPIEAGDTAAFYDPRTGSLRPEFRAHMRQAAEIADDIGRSSERAAVLARRIASRYPEAGLAAARTSVSREGSAPK
jgi:hypothetical protein